MDIFEREMYISFMVKRSKCAKEGCLRPFEPFHSAVFVACGINIDNNSKIFVNLKNKIKISNLDQKYDDNKS